MNLYTSQPSNENIKNALQETSPHIPSFIRTALPVKGSAGGGLICVLLGALLIGGFLSLFASASPDGLEKVAEEQSFLSQGIAFYKGVMQDYAFPWIADERIAASFAGIAGTLLVFAVLAGAGRALFRLKSPREDQ
ncbi:MAG: PDGLE domain-containing protein [Patescibacteria group bacterium]